jgi:anti-sigma-K factor RskA
MSHSKRSLATKADLRDPGQRTTISLVRRLDCCSRGHHPDSDALSTSAASLIGARDAGIAVITTLWGSVLLWRRAAGVFATLSLALLVAAIIARDAPDFSSMPIIAVVRDGEQHPIWAIRLARAAHQIAADSLGVQPGTADHVYQLWLWGPDAAAPHPLGLLPQSGRKPIAVSPENARLLAGTGELVVTLEPAGGSPGHGPSGPTVFRGSLEGSG